MPIKKSSKGFTLVEAVVAASVFLLFALGIYGGITLVFKIVYQSRLKILETALLSEELEVARNLPYESVGILNGVPAGVLAYSKTVSRNNVNFDIVATVRNIDHPFDGTIGGSPNDTSPADFKLVEMSAICATCNQKTPIKLSTIVSPRQLEGASDNGALFIQVFGEDGLPITGANVHVVNTDQNPDLVIDDTTDADGYLRIIDTPTGTLAYNITVSKNGYSSDYTSAASPSNLSPTKPPSNVNSQTVTDISFSIDLLGAINFHSVNSTCAAQSSVNFNIRGQNVLGLEPNVYKYSQNFASDGSGNYALNNLEFDTYHISPTGTLNYDISGTIPPLPIKLSAGENQEVTAVLKPHTSNSLLVKVYDSGTGLPLSDASVRLTGQGNYDQTLLTGVGYTRQTDWSGGSGQVSYTNETKYFADNGGISATVSAGNVKLKKSGSKYLASGNLESSTLDFGALITLRNLVITPLMQPSQTGANSLKFQLAVSNSSTPASWEYVGPDNTSSTYFSVITSTIPASLSDKRYLRYKAFLSTANTNYTPTLSELSITYTNSCTPPGQAFFNSLSSSAYTLTVTRSGYANNTGVVDVAGNSDIIVNMSVQ